MHISASSFLLWWPPRLSPPGFQPNRENMSRAPSAKCPEAQLSLSLGAEYKNCPAYMWTLHQIYPACSADSGAVAWNTNNVFPSGESALRFFKNYDSNGR